MYYRPDDPVEYLEGCLKKARELGGPDKVRWDTFVGQEKKPLPPLNGGQSRRSLFRNGTQGGILISLFIIIINCLFFHRLLWARTHIFGSYAPQQTSWQLEQHDGIYHTGRNEPQRTDIVQTLALLLQKAQTQREQWGLSL